MNALNKYLAIPSWHAISRRRIAALLLYSLLLVLLVDALRLDLSGPKPSYLLLDRNGAFLAELADPGQDYGYWPVQTLPPRVVATVLALEDRHFYSHPGVDPLAITRAFLQNLKHRKRVSGASTIAMQVARMLDPDERTYWNKLWESWRALVMTVRFGREAVLNAYLRLVPYGNRIHGIAYAARRYLNKPLEDLSWAEIAYLSAIPQAPAHMNPYHENGRQLAIARGSKVLQHLHEGGLINQAEYELAQQQIQEISLPRLNARSNSALHAIFKLQQALAQSPPQKTRENYLIRTTLDMNLQDSVTALAEEAIYRWRPLGAGNAAIVLLDRQTSDVLAWVGSTDYFDREQAGALDFAQVERSPGSALKPFIYALALDKGTITPATILDDLQEVSHGIVNADRSFLGPLLPRQALANSRNVPAANLLNAVGLEETYAFLGDLGLHHDEFPAKRYGLGLSIGAMPVTLEHLVQAYSALANDGKWRPLNWYAGQQSDTRQLLTPATARQITLFLSDPNARLPSFPRMSSTEFAFPVALKTGTSEGLRDAWTMAYSRKYLLGVWIGHPDAKPMRDITGASSAAELARRVLEKLHGNERFGLADLSFPPPEGYSKVAISAMSGKRATRTSEAVFEEWFPPGQEPRQIDESYQQLTIDMRNGLLAHAGTPARFVQKRSFINLPPRYADWLYSAGFQRPPAQVSMLGNKAPAGWRSKMPAPHPLAVAEHESVLKIVSPADGMNLLRDPALPAALNTIGLRAEVSPELKEVLWLIDGKPYQVTPYPFTARWQLQPGEHTIQVRAALSSEISRVVRIRVE